MCLDFLYNFCLKHILFVKEFNEMLSYIVCSHVFM